MPGAPFLLFGTLVFGALITSLLAVGGSRDAAPPDQEKSPPRFVSEVA